MEKLRTKFTELMPQILYFPTFMFNQPPRIYWNLITKEMLTA